MNVPKVPLKTMNLNLPVLFPNSLPGGEGRFAAGA